VVWSREGVIYRITPRRNDEVNDTWMADSGRLLYKQVRAENRLLASRVGGQVVASAQALAAASELLKAGSVAVVGSGRSSVEEQFLTAKLAAALKAPVSLIARVGEGDKLLISADRNPNTRGALLTGLISQLPSAKLESLAAAIDAGSVSTVLSVGEDLAAAGLSAAQLAKVKVIYLGTHENPTSHAAQVVLPTLSVFEKGGSFVNQQFRLQKFAAAVPGPVGIADDLATLSALIVATGAQSPGADLASVWTALAASIPVLAGQSLAKVPETGLVLDASAWAGLAFPEGETLHFKPAKA